MKAKVFCLASAKGGSGKTIMTANLACFLTEIGKKCLIIDFDAATHGMTLLYIVEVSENSNSEKKGIFNISGISNLSETISNSLVKVENGVDLLPATYNFKSGFDPEKEFIDEGLSKVIEELKPNYDIILIDAQAGSDKYSQLAMNRNISDEVLIVSEYDPLSAAGIERLKQVIGEDLDYTRTWVLLNKMLPEFADKFSEFLSITRYLPPIPWNADVVRAYAKRKLAIDLEKGNTFTLAVMRTVEKLLGDSIKDEIKSWAEKRSYALKEPLNDQYANAEKELKFALDAQKKLELQNKKNQLIKIYGLIMPMVLIPYLIYQLTDLTILKKLFQSFELFDTSILLVMITAALVPILSTLSNKILKSEKTTESARYKRRIEVLEEKLKQLETLRAADLETIIKNRKT